MMICGTLTLRYLFRIVLSGAVAKGEDFITSGSVTRQGGKCTLQSRASTEVYYPIHVTTVLAIQATGTALSNGQMNYGYGLVASNANSAGFTLMNCSEEAPRYYKEASWIVIGI